MPQKTVPDTMTGQGTFLHEKRLGDFEGACGGTERREGLCFGGMAVRGKRWDMLWI